MGKVEKRSANQVGVADRYRFELLALRLGVHGPEAIDARVVRSLAKTPLWLELRSLLRSHGFEPYEIDHMMGVHRHGCACWGCIIKMRKAVLAHVRRMKDKAEHNRKVPR